MLGFGMPAEPNQPGERRLHDQLQDLADACASGAELETSGELLTAQVWMLKSVADEHAGRWVGVAELVNKVDGFS